MLRGFIIVPPEDDVAGALPAGGVRTTALTPIRERQRWLGVLLVVTTPVLVTLSLIGAYTADGSGSRAGAPRWRTPAVLPTRSVGGGVRGRASCFGYRS
jgi:hypothetical protein